MDKHSEPELTKLNGAGTRDAPPVFATQAGASRYEVGPGGTNLDLLGLNVLAMAPGRVELEMRDTPPTLLIAGPGRLGCRIDHLCIDGRPFRTVSSETGGFDLQSNYRTIELVCVNHGWECMIEMDEKKLPQIAAEAHDGRFSFREALEGGHDPTLTRLAGMTIDHLRGGAPDRLFIEGLAIAMTARAFEAVRGGTVRSVPTRGTDARIDRAVDYAEAHLGEPLSVAELAAVAAMSPSWFAQSFRAIMGRPVHAYVQHRRLERARILLSDWRLSIQEIADACGFSDAPHLTRAFKARFGTTPAKAREEIL